MSPRKCQRAELVTPAIDLSDCAGEDIELVFEHWYDFWFTDDGFDMYFDGGTVEAAGPRGDFALLGGGADYPGTVAIYGGDGWEYNCLEPDAFHVSGLPGYVENSGGWVTARLSLGRLPAEGPFRVRWVYSTGVSAWTTDPWDSQAQNQPGWYLDQVRFERR